MKVFQWTALALAVSTAFSTMAQSTAPAQENTEQTETNETPSEIEVVEVKGVKRQTLKRVTQNA